MFEDPDLVENFQRAALKDLRPSKPLFESDMPRRNNMSVDRLNLRHIGRRVEAEPYLPDGTFLDHEFTIADSRGTAVAPDMRLHHDQQVARGKFIKKYNDDDYSVPSTGWHPTHLVRDMNAQFYNLKDRMKIFDESMNGRHNGGTAQTKLTGTGICLQTVDERGPEMRDETCYNRANTVNDLSNDTSIGWRRTTDHVFKVARYGQVRATAPISSQNWSKNRSNARVEHDVYTSWKDQNVSKSIILQMIDMARKKQTSIATGQTTLFSEEKDNEMGRARKHKTDATLNSNGQDSQDPTANAELKAERINLSKKLTEFDSQRHAKMIVDPIIVEFMAMINRKMSDREMKDLRESIVQSAEFHQILVEAKTRSAREKFGNEMNWESKDDRDKDESMHVANYRRTSKAADGASKNADFEKFKRASKVGAQRRGNLLNKMYKPDAVTYDNEYGAEIDGVKQIGHMGSKMVRGFIDRDSPSNGLNDLAAKN
jgi:hypothetical protein